jgi:hypothetical protein
MNVGFTGTHRGMSEEQHRRVGHFLIEMLEAEGDQFHHGDCIGADAQAAKMADDLGYVLHSYPASVDKVYRAEFLPIGFMCRQAVEHEVKPALERNHDIVDACDILLAAPSHAGVRPRSGTWATIRYAAKVGRRIVLVDRHGGFDSDFKLNGGR